MTVDYICVEDGKFKIDSRIEYASLNVLPYLNFIHYLI
jgi:hypothetical protein